MQLHDLNVATRRSAGYGLIVLFLISVSLLAYLRLSMLDDSIRLIVSDRYPKVMDANQVLEDISDNAIRMRNMLLMLNTPKGRAILADMQAARGCAVVAGEARNPAQRSAAATSEIKHWIATSVAPVDDGSQLVYEAGTAMQAIVAMDGATQQNVHLLEQTSSAAASLDAPAAPALQLIAQRA